MELDPAVLQMLIRLVPGDFAIYRVTDGALKTLYAAPSLAGISGMTPEEYVAATVPDAGAIIVERDRLRVGQSLSQLQNGAQEARIDYRIRHRQQDSVWVHAHARLLGEMGGDTVLMVLFSDYARQAKEPTFLLNNAIANITVVDPENWELLFLNDPARAAYDCGEADGSPCYSKLNGLAAPCAWCPLKQYAGSGRLHVEACHVPVHDRWYRMDGVEMDWFGKRAVALYSVDITARVQRQQTLELDKAKLEQIVQSIPGGVGLIHEENGKICLDYANDSYARAHGGSREYWDRFLGSRAIDGVYEPDRALLHAQFARIRSGASAEESVTYRVTGEDGALHWVTNRLRRAYVQDGVQYYYAAFENADEQKTAEEKLAESQNALREAITHSDIQFFTWFPARHRCELYAVSERLSALPPVWPEYPEDFLAYTKASPADAKLYREMLARVENGADEAECLVRLAYQNTWVWEKLRLHAVRAEDGTLLRAQGYSLNVTARHEAEQRLQRERVRLDSLEGDLIEAFAINMAKNELAGFETSSGIIYDKEAGIRLSAEADAISAPLGDPHAHPREVLLTIAAQIPDQEDRARFLRACSGRAVRDAAQDGRFETTVEYRRRIGGAARWVATRVEVLPDPETGDQVAFFYTRDIHDEVIRRRMNEQIVGQNYAAVAYYDIAADRAHVRAQTLGLNLGPIDGMPLGRAIEEGVLRYALPEQTEALRRRYQLAEIRKKLAASPIETIYYTMTECAERLPGKPHRQVKNDIFYLAGCDDVLVFLLTDVTEIFETERENREKMAAALAAAEQASVAKTEFLSRMSHEIRTPMNAIIGLDAIALQEKQLSPAMEDHLQKIGISARLLLSLINDILDMSRIESGRMVLKSEVFDFEELINGINTILYEQCRDSGLDYDCAVKNDTEAAYIGDRTKLQQVLVNILGNAVKFTPAGGKVHFLIEQTMRGREKACLRFEISDTGIGIDKSFLPHLFEPFSQENRGRASAYGGTGLGLAICKNIVNLMGGSITVHSIKNIGSVFTVEVELQLTPESQRRREQSAHSGLQSLDTLIVDDDVIVCRHTQMVLQEAGLRAEWVESGAGAVTHVEERHAARKDYDLILLDWKMPEMDGVETAHRIRRIVGPDVTIIIMTAYDWTDIEERARAAGVDLFMKKPVFASSVTKAFEQVFSRRGLETLPPAPPLHDYTGRRVLVAEDNEINAEITRNLLTMKNCAVDVAENGATAIEAFATSPVGYYDAILMDVRMPVMDGLEATKSIRAMKKADSRTIPILAMTANAFEEDVRMSLDAGMNAHLAKPIEPELLYQALDRYLCGAGARGQ